MTHLIESQSVYLLHTRPFRDTSLILDFLSRDFGRISAIAKGIRRPGAKNKALLQPFIPLHISVSGRNELKTLRSVELLRSGPELKGNKLFAALYINELLVRLLPGHEAEISLFALYEQTLENLSSTQELESVLRCFELDLLLILGYGIEFGYEAQSGAEIVSEHSYTFEYESGFVLHASQDSFDPGLHSERTVIQGQDILKIGAREFSDAQTRAVAKRIMRSVIQLHLGHHQIKSRQLFSRHEGNNKPGKNRF